MNTWEDGLDRLDVAWCQGQGCVMGSVEQHRAGFRSFNPPTAHLTPEPPDAGEELHKALRLVGQVCAEQVFPEWEPRTQQIAAFDFATDEMRAHKHTVPKAVTDTRPDGEAPDVKLYAYDADSEAEAPGMKETETAED